MNKKLFLIPFIVSGTMIGIGTFLMYRLDKELERGYAQLHNQPSLLPLTEEYLKNHHDLMNRTDIKEANATIYEFIAKPKE